MRATGRKTPRDSGYFPIRLVPAAPVARAVGGPRALSPAARVRLALFGIPPGETSVARRGFEVPEAAMRERLEAIGLAFVRGYHAALERGGAPGLGARLDDEPLELRGFAFEGAAMALALLDAISPFDRGRWTRFARGDGAPHLYMLHVGAGWAIARLPRALAGRVAGFDPLLRWLALDGRGFHDGYFARVRRVKRGLVPRGISGYARRAYDQGLGRSLWFGEGGEPGRIAAAIAGLDAARHADLWSGAGLAAAYAGGADRGALEGLRARSGIHRDHLAQGAAFAAKARERAGNPAAHTALACEVLCGLAASEAARVCDDALEPEPRDGVEPAYESWRARVRSRFAREGSA